MSTSRHVVHVSGPVPPPLHGASKVTHRVVAELRARGVEVRVHDSNSDRTLPQRLGRLLWTVVALAATVVRGRRGALYIGGAGGELIWFQAVVVAVGRLAGHRLVFHHHNYTYLDRRSVAMAAVVGLGGRRVRHVVLCEEMGRRLGELYPGAVDVLVCSNAGHMPESRDLRERASSGRVVLGHLSNLTVEKGLPLVLESLRRLRDADVDVELALAGPCASPEASELVDRAAREFGDRLSVLGPVRPEDVDDFYRDIDLFLLPSDPEAEGMVVLDAMRHGVPAVSFAVGCLPGMVRSEHAVPRGGDFPGTVVRVVTSGHLARSGDIARAYDDRRERAGKSFAALVQHLAGGD